MKYWRIILFTFSSFAIYLITIGPFSNYRKVLMNQSSPGIILVLGGDSKRESIGLRLSKELNIPIIISGGSNPEHANWLIQKEGVSTRKVKLDYRAKDTISNFTSIIDDLNSAGVEHILMITSQNHFERAQATGSIIVGSQGIKLTGISIECSSYCKPEKKHKKALDTIRALTWIITKKDPRLIVESKYKEVQSLVKN